MTGKPYQVRITESKTRYNRSPSWSGSRIQSLESAPGAQGSWGWETRLSLEVS